MCGQHAVPKEAGEVLPQPLPNVELEQGLLRHLALGSDLPQGRQRVLGDQVRAICWWETGASSPTSTERVRVGVRSEEVKHLKNFSAAGWTSNSQLSWGSRGVLWPPLH